VTQVPEWTADYIGLPFREKGRDRDGLDCWGLVRLVLAEQFGVLLPSYADDYACTLEVSENARLISGRKGDWSEVPAGEERAGDVLLLRMAGHECHVGIVVAPGIMLHIEAGHDAVWDRYHGLRWKNRVVGAYRWAAAR